jgi:hypothetical protein
VLRVVALDCRFVGRAAIAGERFGALAMTTDGLGQTLLRGGLVTLLGAQTVNRLAVLVDGPGQIAPRTLHFYRGLIETPAHPHGTRAPRAGCVALGALLADPAVNGRLIPRHPTGFHEFFDVVCAQRLGHIPTAPHANDLFGKVRPLETDRHRLAPSWFPVDY